MGRKKSEEKNLECGIRCNYELNSCTLTRIRLNGEEYVRGIKKEDYSPKFRNWGGNCHDCGIIVQVGNVHHYGCDMEKCPRCGDQLEICLCSKEELIGLDGRIIDIRDYEED